MDLISTSDSLHRLLQLGILCGRFGVERRIQSPSWVSKSQLCYRVLKLRGVN
jgi:hypothetical protein